MRLAKYLAHAGVASRRGAEAIIAEGRVSVGGRTVGDPALDVDEHSSVAVDGRPLAGAEAHVVYMLNKPLGVLSTTRDTHGRTTVTQLLPEAAVRLYPVGRLDAQTSGLILLTNDGELANRLTHPRFEVRKTYVARLRGGVPGGARLRMLREGVKLEDGLTAPAEVRVLSKETIEVTIREGRNRQVRRMCEHVGHPVVELERIRFGPLSLGRLAPGDHRALSRAELALLRSL